MLAIGSDEDLLRRKSELAGTIRGFRKSAGLTQRQTAHLAGCCLSSVANLEAGLVPNRSEVAERILTVLRDEIAALEAQTSEAASAGAAT